MPPARPQTSSRAGTVPVGAPRGRRGPGRQHEALVAELEAVNLRFDAIAHAVVNGLLYDRVELAAVMQRRKQLQERLAQVEDGDAGCRS
jgi:hypothetical protein